MTNEQKIRIASLRRAGCGYTAIARELGLPLGTVKTRINRARKTLEKMVENPADGKAD